MIPVLARARAKTLEEFGQLVRHPGEEFTYVVEGETILHTEFYDPIVLKAGDSVYFDSSMGHAYLAGQGCDEVVLLCACSSADDSLMESLLNMHGNNNAAAKTSATTDAEKRPSKTSRRSKGRLARPSAAPAL